MPRSLEHKQVNRLPVNAIKVSEYARQRGCTTSLIYHEVKRGKAKFNIIVWQGINFILPH